MSRLIVTSRKSEDIDFPNIFGKCKFSIFTRSLVSSDGNPYPCRNVVFHVIVSKMKVMNKSTQDNKENKDLLEDKVEILKVN